MIHFDPIHFDPIHFELSHFGVGGPADIVIYRPPLFAVAIGNARFPVSVGGYDSITQDEYWETSGIAASSQWLMVAIGNERTEIRIGGFDTLNPVDEYWGIGGISSSTSVLRVQIGITEDKINIGLTSDNDRDREVI